MFCLIKSIANKFREAIKNGDFSAEVLSKMKSSKDARDYFAKFVGKENAEAVNLLYEKKLLLKNQEKAEMDFYRELLGDKKFIEQKTKLSEQAQERAKQRQESIYNPGKEDKMFDEISSDAYTRKYNTEVSLEQSQQITELASDLKIYKDKMKDDFTWDNPEDKIKAGASERALTNYVSSIKSDLVQKNLINPLKENGLGNKVEAMLENARISLDFIAQTSRSIVAGVADNSFWGNQGIKTMWNTKTVDLWAKNFAKSFIDIKNIAVKGVTEGDKIMDGVYADFYTRPNRLNGRYTASVEGGGKKGKKLDIGTGEEEISTDVITKINKIPYVSKIPILKQAFEIVARGAKAANVAYEAGAMRLRMDIADRYYGFSEKAGKNLNDNYELGSTNTIINSMTGRGGIGAFENAGKEINWAVFSVKFAKSNVDFLTAHWFDPSISVDAKIRATKNLMNTVAIVGTTLFIASKLDPDSTDLHPLNSKFGKLYGQDITGSLASYVTLVGKIVTQSTRNPDTGKITKLGTGVAETSGWDVFTQFLENKTSPMATVIKDLAKQETFNKEKPTLLTETKGLMSPMGITNTTDILNEPGGNMFLKLISAGLNLQGFNKNVYAPSPQKKKVSPIKSNLPKLK